MKLSMVTKICYAGVLYILLYVPLIVLIVFSFNDATHSLLWHGFTWRWYKALFHDEGLLTVAWHSLVLSTLSASIATLIGVLGAVSLYRYKFAGKKLLNGLIFILIIIPDIVMGISLLILFSLLHMRLGFISLLLSHITFCVPFVVVVTYGRLADFNQGLIEAARDLGATDYQAFLRVIFPLLKPAVFSAWLLSFALSIDDVIISFFVSGPSFQILPLYIYSQVKTGPTPEINALCSIILIVTFGIVVFAQRLLKRRV